MKWVVLIVAATVVAPLVLTLKDIIIGMPQLTLLQVISNDVVTGLCGIGLFCLFLRTRV